MPHIIKTPGVYVEELSKPLEITGVETSVAAFVGSAQMGLEQEPMRIASFAEFKQNFGGLAAEHMLSYAVHDFFLNGGKQALVLRISGSGARRAQIHLPCAGKSGNVLKLEASSTGLWGNELSVQVQQWEGPNRAIGRLLKRAPVVQRFRLHVYFREQLVEVYPELSLIPGDAAFLPEVLSSQSRLLRATGTARAWDIPTTEPLVNLVPIHASGGQDGSALTVSDYLGNEALERGIYALNKASGFNLLCIPPAQRNGNTDPVVYHAALRFCAQRRAILLIDAPSTWTGNTVPRSAPSAELLGIQGLETINAAVYAPRLLQRDPLQSGTDDVFVPCGAVAGLIAATDAQYGVWKSPAGTSARLAGVKGLQPVFSTAELESLNVLGINGIRHIPGSGFAVWGARTLYAEGEYKYLAVRRTALFIEESVSKGIAWACFETHDEQLWNRVTQLVDAFMMRLFRAGAFQGNQPSAAYFVKCDRETTTPQDVSDGYFNLLIGFAPLKPAEFVVLRLRQKTGLT